jgi:hypothetical protein
VRASEVVHIDPERDHFVRQIRDLGRSRSRWRLAALVLAAVLALPVVLGGLLGVALVPRLELQRARAERDVLEAERARAEAERVRALAAEAEAARLRDQAEAARQEAEKAKGTGRH